MGQFVQVNGDYNIKTAEGGKIKFDTGPGIGEVRITGDLVVEGDTLTVSAENLQVQDNIITLNFGETGAGVTEGTSGLEIDRGTLDNAYFLWQESDDSWNLKTGSGYDTSKLRLTQLLTNADTLNPTTGRVGDLTLIGVGAGVVSVKGTLNYELNVTDDDDVPNKKYVDDAIQTNPTFQVLRGDTRVSAFDISQPLDPGLFPIGPYGVQPSSSQVSVVVDDLIVAEYFSNQIRFAGLQFFTEDPTNPLTGLTPDAAVIQTTNSGANLKLETNDTGRVEITYALQLDNHGLTPGAIPNTTILYAGNVGGGTTGVFFNNSTKNDELIGKNRSLLYSMIF
jgi:hypothetical protein